MAILDIFRTKVTAVSPDAGTDVSASLYPIQTTDSITSFGVATYTATREEFMSIPTCSRARSIICSSIASIPMHIYDKNTGMEVEGAPRVITDPDPRVNGAASWVWCAEDLLLYGYSYFQITSIFQDTFRVRTMERVAPTRVTIIPNNLSTEINGFRVDGFVVPNSGIGSLVVFNGNDEGVLNRAGRTIRAGAELERAAVMYAREPIPTMVLKSNGTALPPDRISKLLEAWGTARRNRATAFLNADVELQAVGFDPEKMQLAAARSYVATELARAVGIPAFFVDADTGSSMTYSNQTTTRQTLLDFSLRPLATSIEQRLSMSDFVPSSQTVRFNFDDYLRGSAIERANVYKILSDIGAITPDEIRIEEDMIR